MKKAVVVFSGGQDSTTVLYHAQKEGFTVHAITFDYCQRHQREIDAACIIAALAGVSHEVITIGTLLKGTSPLTDLDKPLKRYKDHESLPGGLEDTFVPMRNQFFLTLAANRAYAMGINILFTGVASEDFGGYPDCRRDFINALEIACCLGTFTGETGTLPPLSIVTPLMYKNKADTVYMALGIPGCYEALAFSHTSYGGEYPPTGKDHASLLRAKGFEDAGVPDPLILRARLGDSTFPFPKTQNYDFDNDRVLECAQRIAYAIDAPELTDMGSHVHR